ncbi:MAG: zinc-ribbon domain-containing protein [Acidobacteriia bacterium]|jgi:uncharacterized membrane protein|nr:zinc-ribbon domain-containing protein [Terriglobia bacterium]
MAFCAKCGAQLAEGVTFCGGCGAPVGAAPGATPPAAASSEMASNVAGLLTYILGFITGIIFLVIEPFKNDKFVRFHAFQSIFFNVAIVAFWIIYTILSTILGIVSFGVLGIVMALVGLLISLLILVYWIFLMYKAYNYEQYMIPYIGQLAAKQAGL